MWSSLVSSGTHKGGNHWFSRHHTLGVCAGRRIFDAPGSGLHGCLKRHVKQLWSLEWKRTINSREERHCLLNEHEVKLLHD